MPTVPASETDRRPRDPEKRILARAVSVWWVQRLLEAARRRRAARSRAAEADALGTGAPRAAP